MKKNLLISMLIAVFVLSSFLIAMPTASAWRTSSLELARLRQQKYNECQSSCRIFSPDGTIGTDDFSKAGVQKCISDCMARAGF